MTNVTDKTMRDLMDVLAARAWAASENARILPPGKTKVGCAVLVSGPELPGIQIFSGANIQHTFRKDMHAEPVAIGSAVAAGYTDLLNIVIVARRERFTPCGGCLDWIFEFGGEGCLVSWQSEPGGPITSRLASELMPHYPC